MKLVTEFPSYTLMKALAAKTALTTAGKTPEEIEASLGETFKLEGDKLKYFVNALNVANDNSANLKRVFVATLAEGENIPAKSVKVEEHHYIPEFLSAPKPAFDKNAKPAGKGGRQGGGKGDKKGGSPWGMSPEELAAKKGGKGAAKPS
ncbi:hypothetical protein AZI86_01170 [Bdellovibrio bacteriovorus]|uniref:Uncharacterized protein n=1 Tax=Bdellovibrio bacteriovorus TaxID=959 RepID=A0A150WMW8_BDEBC|nr:hypothetical protein [Bdellovibrio bacteriovorus]KYG65716.1 hypothetical protein AZI86_01170 [Bdellovibrio bacteriovorus]